MFIRKFNKIGLIVFCLGILFIGLQQSQYSGAMSMTGKTPR